MPRFITIGYGDEAGYNRTSPSVREVAHRRDERLRKSGAIMGTVGSPVQVRNHGDEGVRSTPGSFMHADLPIAGFALIEATGLDDAIDQVSKTPCAVAYGVVEIWPLEA